MLYKLLQFIYCYSVLEKELSLSQLSPLKAWNPNSGPALAGTGGRPSQPFLLFLLPFLSSVWLLHGRYACCSESVGAASSFNRTKTGSIGVFWKNGEATEQQRWKGRLLGLDWEPDLGFPFSRSRASLPRRRRVTQWGASSASCDGERPEDRRDGSWRWSCFSVLGNSVTQSLVLSEWSADEASSIAGSRWGSASHCRRRFLHLVDSGAHTIGSLKTVPVSMLPPRPDFYFSQHGLFPLAGDGVRHGRWWSYSGQECIASVLRCWSEYWTHISWWLALGFIRLILIRNS